LGLRLVRGKKEELSLEKKDYQYGEKYNAESEGADAPERFHQTIIFLANVIDDRPVPLATGSALLSYHEAQNNPRREEQTQGDSEPKLELIDRPIENFIRLLLFSRLNRRVARLAVSPTSVKPDADQS
jgi:hypothetical protein